MRIRFNFNKLNYLRGVAIALALSTPFALTGCSKKADCDVSGSHAHLYKNESGYVRYIDKEYLSYEGYERSNEYIPIEGEESLYKFLDKKDLMRIDDNLELIQQVQESNEDYTEYRYKYTYMQPIPHIMRTGKTTTVFYTYISHTRYSWTSDPNHSRLTGETRLCHHMYVAYKVEQDENGKYVLIPSPDVEDLTTVMDEYPYIKKTYIKIVTSDGKEASYEDGKQEDMSEEEKRRAEEYDATHSVEPTAQSHFHTEEKGMSLVKRYTYRT
jgi:hypothetical protein